MQFFFFRCISVETRLVRCPFHSDARLIGPYKYLGRRSESCVYRLTGPLHSSWPFSGCTVKNRESDCVHSERGQPSRDPSPSRLPNKFTRRNDRFRPAARILGFVSPRRQGYFHVFSSFGHSPALKAIPRGVDFQAKVCKTGYIFLFLEGR